METYFLLWIFPSVACFLLNFFVEEEITIKDFIILFVFSSIPGFNFTGAIVGWLKLEDRFFSEKRDFYKRKINDFMNKKIKKHGE